jgi:hypothetical protein
MVDLPQEATGVSFPHQDVQADAHADRGHLHHAGAVTEKYFYAAEGTANAPSGQDRCRGRWRRLREDRNRPCRLGSGSACLKKEQDKQDPDGAAAAAAAPVL